MPVPTLLFDWVAKPWIGDNSPYQKIRKELDEAQSKGKLTPNILETYRVLAMKAQNDPKALFRWAYACNIATHNYPPIHPKYQPADGAFDFPRKDPYTYDYERIRYLLNYDTNPKALKPLGVRLEMRDPKDYLVLYSLAGMHSALDSPREQQASVMRVQRLIQLFPHEASSYTIMGAIYYEQWLHKKSPSDAKRAIFYYQKYLGLAPKNAEGYDMIASLVTELQRGK